jgi:hypothetical protein
MGTGTKFGITAETGNNIQTDGLVAYYDAAYKKSYTTGSLPPSIFNLASGSLTPTGSLKNDTTFTTQPISASSWVFDGIDDYVATGLNLSYVTYPNITLSVWVKMDKADLSTWSSYNPVGVYVGTYSNSTPIRIYTNGTTVAYVAVQGAGGTTYSTTDLSDGNWHNIIQTCEYDAGGTINNVYIDGVKEITDKLFLSWGKITGDLIIGAQTASNWRFLGNIANCQIYNRSLSTGDVLQNFNAQKERFGY